tara:strand:- start:117 stop:293 length:177 start_codon:yes stop_codon:yes gene_type:complete
MNNTELFINRVLSFQDKNKREKVWNKMGKNNQDIVNSLIKKALTYMCKKPYIGGKRNV